MNNSVDQIKNTFLNQHINNQKTLNNIGAINQLLATQSDYQQFIETLKQWKDDPSLSIQNYTFWLFLVFGILCLILMVAVHPYFFVIAVLSIAFAFYKRTSKRPLNDLIQYTQQKVLQQKYQIQFNAENFNHTIQSPYHFPLFSLGNHENIIRNEVYGQWQIDQQIYPYMLFNYHYVDEEETEDSEGKKKTEYRHYDLWGIMLENFPISGISIATKQKRVCRLGVKWSSGDIRFDEQYQLSGVNEMQLAKFFTPQHILTLEHVLGNFKGDVYVHPQSPSMCWLFKTDILKQYSDVESIQTVQDLAANLENLCMPNYEQLRDSLLELLREIQPHYSSINK